ncbi:6-phosphogluconolactonase (cycloisomerase 2 family) [Rhodanobacter sp. K2T2]|uniref:hypothetical protein n=1 Tax=Rhodanobacter sp. K2T2 TaxID=2723085 RepID=UPI0015CA1982|nr:hypothetical protein [Rhodanobacter sp. K2T2]NYE30087.1 6-phosphogluconolactonase (cycloisomerase 2 family) [Rhodanobacter sp. K2T2]
MKKTLSFGIGALSLMIATAVAAQNATWSDNHAVVVTATNASTNDLLIYNTQGVLQATIPTRGSGGATGNAGGITQDHDRLAVINFGSGNVTVFSKDTENLNLRFEKLVPALTNPVSVALANHHLYILTTSYIESHRIDQNGVASVADGKAKLFVGDGSAAQVGVLQGQLILSEKSNVIETVHLNEDGAINGNTKEVANIPSNVNAPFGLATRANDAYVSIAHANELSLVRNDAVVTVTSSGTQSAPCWVTPDGPFLFSVNAASKTVSRYAVYGEKIIQDAPVVATIAGAPTDIAFRSDVAAVVDAGGSVSHVSIYNVDGDGDFTLKGFATINAPAANGVAIVRNDQRIY